MSPRLHVDTEELLVLADRLRSAAAGAAGLHTGSEPVRATVAGLGDSGLVAASTEFLERWSAGLREVVGDAERLADLITLVARTTADAEAATARSFRP